MSMSPDDQIERAVRELQDRQAIYDCLMRYSRAVDRLDRELHTSTRRRGAFRQRLLRDDGDGERSGRQVAEDEITVRV